VRAPRHRIFRHPECREEAARYHVDAGPVSRCGDQHTAHLPVGNGGHIGADGAHQSGVVHHANQVVIAAEHRAGRDAERCTEIGWPLHRHRDDGGEVHGDQPGLISRGGEHAAPGVEAGRCVARQDAGIPEEVRRRQRGVAAQIHLGHRGEPPQPEAVAPPGDEGGLGLVHLHRDRLTPGIGARRSVKHDHPGRIAGEGTVGEGIDQVEHRHDSLLFFRNRCDDFGRTSEWRGSASHHASGRGPSTPRRRH